jgi:hypothetical protein
VHVRSFESAIGAAAPTFSRDFIDEKDDISSASLICLKRLCGDIQIHAIFSAATKPQSVHSRLIFL